MLDIYVGNLFQIMGGIISCLMGILVGEMPQFLHTEEADVESLPPSLKESLYLKNELKGVSGRKKKEMEVSQLATATNQPPSSESSTTNSFNPTSIPVTNPPSLATPFHYFEFENQRAAHPFFHIQGYPSTSLFHNNPLICHRPYLMLRSYISLLHLTDHHLLHPTH